MNRIKELRSQNGWLQEDLEKRLHLGRGNISNYENEKRTLTPELINKLCDLFGCTADYLLGRSEVRTFEFSADEAALLYGYRALSAAGKEYLRHTLALAQLAHGEKNGAVSGMETAN